MKKALHHIGVALIQPRITYRLARYYLKSGMTFTNAFKQATRSF